MAEEITESILKALQELDRDDRPDEVAADRSSSPVDRRVRDMLRRTGVVDGVRCFVEETPHGSFRLHGFKEGDWRLSRQGWVGEEDEQAVRSRHYTLTFLRNNLGYAVHAIDGLNTIVEADAFFGEAHVAPWKATRIDGGTQREVSQTIR